MTRLAEAATAVPVPPVPPAAASSLISQPKWISNQKCVSQGVFCLGPVLAWIVVSVRAARFYFSLNINSL